MIICTYNRAETLRVVLEDMLVQRAADIPWELVVVDNNSGDNTREVVEEMAVGAPIPVRYVFEPRQGKSFALNTAILVTRGEVLAFTDDDMRIDPGWVSAIASAFASGQCDLVGGCIRALWPAGRPDWYLTTGPYKLLRTNGEWDLGTEIVAMSTSPFGGNMAVSRAMIERYGGFRTDLGPKGQGRGLHEDTEFGSRLIAAGARCLFLPNAIVDHRIQEQHTTKAYVQEWYFNFGRSDIQQNGTAKYPRLFGIPRYLYREGVTYSVKWLLSVGTSRRFHYRLLFYRVWGSAREAYSMWRAEARDP